MILIQEVMLDVLEREDFEKLNRLADAEEEMNGQGTALLVHLRHVLSSRNASKTTELHTGASLSEMQIRDTKTVDISGVEGNIGGKHGTTFRLKKYLQSAAKSDRWQEIKDRTVCVSCRQPAILPYITDCFHIYCLQYVYDDCDPEDPLTFHRCLTDASHTAARRGQDSARCVECGNHYSDCRPCDSLETLAEQASTRSSIESGSSGKQKGQDEDWLNLKGEVLPSTKTMAAKMQCLLWLEEKPDAKIIIYTQFIPLVHILERICKTEKWGCLKYTGKMSHDARDNAIQEFRDRPDVKILIASMQAGGLGLNLTVVYSLVCGVENF